MTAETILLTFFALYLGAGIVTAILFFAYGASKLSGGAPVSYGARVLFIPATILMWPAILRRWLLGGA